MVTDFPLIGGFNRYANGLDFDTEDLVNLYVLKDEDGKKGIALLNTPGLGNPIIIQPGNSPSRALYVFQNIMVGVFGSGVYLFNGAPTPEELVPILIGTIGTDSGYISISANNGNQIIFADGQAGYIYNTQTGIFSKITSSDFPPSPLNVVFLNTYFVIPSAQSQQYQLSANNDGTSWNALADEAQIQTYPGDLIGVGIVNQRLYFFKDTSTEIWYDAGYADFPLRRDNNLIFNFGCLATASIVSEYGYLFWLANDKSGPSSIMMSTGYSPQRISNFAVESLIATFIHPSDVICYLYKEDGHIFYVMNWTTDDYTLVYDVMTNEWHRMEMEPFLYSVDDPYSHKIRHIGNCHAYFNGVHYIGSYKSPILYPFSRQYADNAGQPIRRERTTKPFFDPNYRKFQINKFQPDIQPGIGNNDGIYKNPNAYLSISRDGGHVFGNNQPAIIGKIGARQTRIFWRKKGLARSFIARLTIYASVAPILIMGASIDYEVLPK